jgi:hypothetical protein
MITKAAGQAARALAQQVEICGGGEVSLDNLWRVAGRPPGHDPRTWLQLAEPLVDGYGSYRAKVGPAAPEIPRGRVVWIWAGDSKEPWREGDLMSGQLLAIAYAIYLDEHLDADHEDRRFLD